MNNKRWYDIAPEVCMLIGQIELSLGDDKIKYARRILKELMKAGYKPQKKDFEEKMKKYSLNRWYDYDKAVFLAFEYLKDVDTSLQKCIATRVHNYIMDSKQGLLSRP